jgi:hypothetical protein
MGIKEIFQSRATSQSDLVRKYRNLQTEKAELELKASELKERALDADVDDLTDKLQKIHIQVELCDSACSQVEKQLAEMIEKDVQRNYQTFDAEKAKYQNELDRLSKESGQLLGRSIQSLQTLNLSFARNLAQQIRQTVVSYDKDVRFKSQMAVFLESYSAELNTDQGNTTDFRAWKSKLKMAEKLEPGSVQAAQHVKGEIKDLLRAT